MSNELKSIQFLSVYVPEVKSTLEYKPSYDRNIWICECRDLSGSITNQRLISFAYFADIYRRFKDNPNTTINHV
tara:strand:+ start:190 stop:411 length:222 start_codon:yes stop_codon:yes gene_type:complete